jgi:hypothetical protein
LKHFASTQFWRAYQLLSPEVRALADKNFQLLKADPHHPSLHFKKIGNLRSVRVGARYRALGLDKPEGVVWFWIGSHADYDKLLP